MGRMYFLQDRTEAMNYLRLGIEDNSVDGEISRVLFDFLQKTRMIVKKKS
jgi:hypothetical protein